MGKLWLVRACAGVAKLAIISPLRVSDPCSHRQTEFRFEVVSVGDDQTFKVNVGIDDEVHEVTLSMKDVDKLWTKRDPLDMCQRGGSLKRTSYFRR